MVRFGPYEVDFGARELRKCGVRIRIQDQQLKVLEALLERPGQLVSRDELRDRLWRGDTFVDFDKSLNVAIAKLRQILSDSADVPRYIETVPRQGNRFIAPLTHTTTAVAVEAERASAIPNRRFKVVWAAVIPAAALLLAVGLIWSSRPRPQTDNRLVQLDLEVGNAVSQPAVTRDGTAIAFITDGRLAVRCLDSGSVTQLRGTEGASSPFFSPDGKSIAYFAGRKLRRISAEGGEALIICDAPSDRGGAWTEDGRIIAGLGDWGALYSVSASGGTPQPFTTIERDQTSLIQHRRPSILPGSAGFLLIASTGVGHGSVQVVGPAGGAARTVIAEASGAWYLPGGYLVFQRGPALFAASFDLRRLEITSQPWPILEGVSDDYFRGANVDVSPSGTLVFRASPVPGSRRIVWLDPQGETSARDLPAPGPYSAPRLSPDGKRLAIASEVDGGMQIWVFELGHARMTRLTYGDVRCCPVWSPDGQYVVFSTGRSLSWARWDGPGDLGSQNGPEGSVAVPWSFSPDDRWLAFHRNQPNSGYDLWIAPVSRANASFQVGAAKPLLIRPGIQAAPAISPDGKWLAYASDENGRAEVYVTAFSGTDGASAQNQSWRISTDGGRAPKWDVRGSRIFFHGLDNRIMAATVFSRQEGFAAEPPVPWSPLPVGAGRAPPNFDIAPDGRRVVAVLDAAQAKPDETHLRILLNVETKIRAAAERTGKRD